MTGRSEGDDYSIPFYSIPFHSILFNSQQGGNCLEFGDNKLTEGGCGERGGKKCPCPCQHGKETPETTDPGKLSRQLSPQSINTVVAFSVLSPEIKQAIESVKYIAENMRSRNKAKEVIGKLVLACNGEIH